MSGPGPDSDSFGPSRVPSIRKRCLFRRPAGLSFRWCPEGTFEPHLFLGDSLPGLVCGRHPAVPAVAGGGTGAAGFGLDVLWERGPPPRPPSYVCVGGLFVHLFVCDGIFVFSSDLVADSVISLARTARWILRL